MVSILSSFLNRRMQAYCMGCATKQDLNSQRGEFPTVEEVLRFAAASGSRLSQDDLGVVGSPL